MSASVPGYEYDLFISYRRKDNLDGWVTRFVADLLKELQSTLKEDITVYFDQNPHDGLLETDQVAKSLEGKLNCLLLLTILSQTYCDKQSFAWQHEFTAFGKAARKSTLGIDIHLRNGNVSSRILPVLIHDLDPEDRSAVETELGGPIRGVSFVYREPGVNRPLQPADRRDDNHNKTDYRNQLNKLANSIKESVLSVSANAPSQPPAEFNQQRPEVRKTRSVFRWVTTVSIALLTSMLVYFLFFRDKGPRRIAVLPFANQTGNTQLNSIGIGIASAAHRVLSVSQPFVSVSSLSASLRYEDAKIGLREIGSLLGVDQLVTGFYQRRDSVLRIQIEGINALNEQVVWSAVLDWDMKNPDALDRMIASKVRENLALSATVTTTSNPDAYAYYQRGIELLKNAYGDSVNGTDAFSPIVEQHEKAIQLDSGFLDAWTERIAIECFLYEGRINSDSAKAAITSHVATFDRIFPEDSWQKNLVHGEYNLRVDVNLSVAHQSLLNALEVNPNSEHVLYALSNLESRRLNIRQAIQFAARLVQVNRAHGGHWINLGMLLDRGNDPTHAMKAFVKAWEYSKSPNFARFTILQAVGSGYPLDQLPGSLKAKAKAEYQLWELIQQRQWQSALQAGRRTNDRVMTAILYRQLKKPDSARIWIALAVQHHDADSTLYYELHGQREKALLYDSKQRPVSSPEQVLGRREEEISLAISFEDYEEATRKLQAVIADYPELGLWTFYGAYPFYDNICNEYEPFRNLVRRPPPPPLVDIESLAEF